MALLAPSLPEACPSQAALGILAHCGPPAPPGAPALQPGAPEFSVGWAQSQGNRPYQDDRCIEFLLPLSAGGAALVWAVSGARLQTLLLV